MFKFDFYQAKTTNFLLWRNQITPLVHDIGILYHLLNGKKLTKEIKDGERSKSLIPQYQLWINNDRLLTSWLLEIMK